MLKKFYNQDLYNSNKKNNNNILYPGFLEAVKVAIVIVSNTILIYNNNKEKIKILMIF